MNTITFTVPGAPIGKGRPRATSINGMARLYTPKKTANYEGLVAHAAHEAMAGRTPMEDAATVTMNICCPIPASWSQKKQRMAALGEIRPTTKPDIDNVVKGVFDGMNGVVWRDDVVVAELIVRKFYSLAPCVQVVVRPLQEAVMQVALLEAA